jgi:branched-chain amino acid aminotransferase
MRQGKLFTPGSDQDILAGITRDSIIVIARKLGIEVVERPIDKSELFIADEIFLCGTAAKIAPVSRIENYLVPQVADSITSKLQQELVAITQGQHHDYRDWLCSIDLQ